MPAPIAAREAKKNPQEQQETSKSAKGHTSSPRGKKDNNNDSIPEPSASDRKKRNTVDDCGSMQVVQRTARLFSQSDIWRESV